jgi:hypothetical protein
VIPSTAIKELFRTFFPGKEFLGVTLGEKDVLAFPVRLSTGETHDIDELSSGEKEIVYGYLWLRSPSVHHYGGWEHPRGAARHPGATDGKGVPNRLVADQPHGHLG